MNYFLQAMSKYADFNGRARRSEYWYFVLFIYIIFFILGLLIGMLGSFGAVLIGIFYLGILIPSISVAVRRMHDVDKSGWFLLVPIYNLILALTPGTTGLNRFGPDPKGGDGGFIAGDEKILDSNL